jgi:hypothetical protein
MDEVGERAATETCLSKLHVAGAVSDPSRKKEDYERLGGVSDFLPVDEIRIVDMEKFRAQEALHCSKTVAMKEEEEDLKTKYNKKHSIIKRKGKRDIIMGGQTGPSGKTVRVRRR